jgi:release factor glutamine methyltransferase
MEVYEPREDSWLLKSVLKDFAKGICLDMGTGSGILAEEAAKYCNKVIAVDVNKKAIEYCKNNCPDKTIEFRHSDLFKKISESFDTILFNFPFLPGSCGDIAVDGGKDGLEVMKKFLKEAKNHLNPGGIMLIVFSGQTNIEKLNKMIIENNYTFKKIAEKQVFFEELYVYKVER